MNVIIGYENSAASDYIFVDLLAAGLPEDAHFVVVSATDLEPLSTESQRDLDGLLDLDKATWQRGISPEERRYLIDRLLAARNHIESRMNEVEVEAASAAEKLRQAFPSATVEHVAVMGSPYNALVEQARKYNGDLIIVGSQSASALTRYFLGSVSQKVVSHASSSVRVARAQANPDPSSLHLVIAFDGSEDSQRTIDVVAMRKWPINTSVRVVTVEEPKSVGFLVSTLGRLLHAEEREAGTTGENDLVHYLAGTACERLKRGGLHAQPVGIVGEPKHELLKLIDDWKADCIFLGARGHHAKGEQHLGAVANALATRAHCSLEIVR